MAKFVYYNNNPRGERENDCVTRAITLALDEDYKYIRHLLYSNAYNNCCDRLTKMCYRQILEDIYRLKPRLGNGRTVGEIADYYSDYNVIMRVKGHLTCSVVGGIIKDLWDTRYEIVDTYWVIDN